MQPESFTQKAGRTAKRVVRWIIGILVVVLIAVFSFYYWGVYEKGVMAGRVLRITEKGVMFKTFEGKLNLETFGALKNASPIAESFDFSVEKSNDEIIKQLEEVALSGERVNLHFVRRYVTFPWRGETKYFVVRVERLDK